ncbi:MAG TPA: sodium:proton antiporter [Phycisphaerae bacterium]|nr:sodium:proton antiporter [Phycisphaerae bacterium]
MTQTAPDTSRRAPLLHLSHPDHHIPGFEFPENASEPPSTKICLLGFLIAVAIALLGALLHYLGNDAPIPSVAFPWILPFAALLASIAIMPFAAKHFWEKNYQNVSIGLGLIVISYYIFGLSAQRMIAETFADYISFIFLLGSLFVVSGGVIIRIHRKATPAANVALLLIGALLANVFGTTGASMLLIRPYLRLNKRRPKGVRPFHVVFFIFAVANVGGALTPVGDPPLFLGYLKGVPFWWVVQHSWPIWLTAVGCLAAAFFVLDTLHARRESAAVAATAESNEESADPPASRNDAGPQPFEIVSIFGAANIVFIAMILVGVFLDAPYREILMAAAAFGSLATTSRRIYGENHFNYAPIKEVALLFIGIFATMIPAMNYLHNHANDPLFKRSLNTPGQFYFASGALSSVLDNAPTYVTFLETALGKIASQQPVIDREKSLISTRALTLTDKDHVGLTGDQSTHLKELHATLLRYHGEELANGKLDPSEAEIGYILDDSGALTDGTYPLYKFLIAVSMGAVFFGACTYIGNGPNFMVKSIADHAGIKTPSFFAYIFYFTLPLLLPILILCWAIFLR